LLLSALKTAAGLSNAGLGHVATLELLAMATMAGVSGALLKPRFLRQIALTVVVIAALANVVTFVGNAAAITAARLVSGCCSGLLLWLLMNVCVRLPSPARILAFALTVTYSTALLLAMLCSRWLIPTFGPSSVFGCLIVFNLLMVLPALALPGQLREGKGLSDTTSLPRAHWYVVASLGAIVTFEAALTSLWIYFVPVSIEVGHAADRVATAVSVCIACQILGGLTAIVLGRRASYGVVLGATTVIALLGVAIIGRGANAVTYFIAVAAFGFSWRLAVPYHVELLIAAEPSRRFAMFTASAQGLGVAAGPFIASLVVTEDSAYRAIDASGALFLLSLLLLAAVRWRVQSLVSRQTHAS
jgi:hypothetical protein